MSSRATVLPLAAVLSLVAALVGVGTTTIQSSASVPELTEAPDLLGVGSFQEGPVTDEGPQTLVEFTFDQVVYLRGDRSGFHLTPTDAGATLNGRGEPPETDTEGDEVVQVLFDGALGPDAVARGFVDSGTVNSDPSNSSEANPTNVAQSEPIAGDGTTQNPDLTEVVIDGDQVLFRFDQPLTSDDVVQNTGGLHVFFPATDRNATIPDANALSVRRGSTSSELRAFFGDDLPEGYRLAEAVGAYVADGTVQAAEGQGGARDGVNALHEVAPVGSTGAEPCAEAPEAGQTEASETGPTEAPDLLAVGNVRRGPFTSNFEPTTCVDFVFDQPAYLNGGNRSSFSLAPVSGDDALPGSTNVAPPNDQPGDRVVTVVFPGELAAQDYARGFVASETLNTAEDDAGPDAPLNVNQAADIAPGTTTQNPDLASVQLDGDAVLWTFDQPLTDDDVAQNSSGLRLYFGEAEQVGTIPSVGSAGVERVAPDQLRALYPEDLPEGNELADAVGAFLDTGAVQAVEGERGGNAGANLFDELTPLGDTGAQVCPAAPQTGEAGERSGPTEGPDLLAVGNVRRGPVTSQFTSTTCVDFLFDQPAVLSNGTRANFSLVPTDASDALPGSTNEVPEADESGDRVVTVAFPGTLRAEDVARGFVDTGTVSSQQDVSADAPLNVNQAEPLAPGTTTGNPDLVRAQQDGTSSVLFEFDQALTDDDVIQNSSGLRLYFAEAEGNATIPSAGSVRVERLDATTLRGSYRDLPGGRTVADAVGAFVDQGTVQAAAGERAGNDGASAFDEVLLGDSLLTGLSCDGEPATITGSGVIPGTDGRDVIVGSAGADDIDAGAGDDLVCGLGGADDIAGGPGDDTLYGDRATNGSGGALQAASAAGVQPAAPVGGDASARTATVTVAAQGDGASSGGGDSSGDGDSISGGQGDDTIVGSDGSDQLNGGPGDDDLDGRAGDDTLTGGAGDDRLEGGPGADDLDGGQGDDTLVRDDQDVRATGGPGRDDCGTTSCDDADAADRGEADSDDGQTDDGQTDGDQTDRDQTDGDDGKTDGDQGAEGDAMDDGEAAPDGSTDSGGDGATADDAATVQDGMDEVLGGPGGDGEVVTGDQPDREAIAATGAPATSLAVFAMLALGLGALLLRSGRRRRTTTG